MPRAIVTIALLLAVLGCLAACDDPALGGLEGRWAGTISCAKVSSSVTMGLQVIGSSITGSAITRMSEVDTDWDVSGSQKTKEREGRCADDTCKTDADCKGRGGLDPETKQPRDSTCDEFGICNPCTEVTTWREVTLTFVDDDVQSIDPVLTLERHGNSGLTGTVVSFCPDEIFVTPHVKLEKE